MELTTRREPSYGGFGHGKRYHYAVHLKGSVIATDDVKDVAVSKAKQALSNAYEYIGRASVIRIATDGTVIVFRYLSSDTAQYEFHRDGKPASGICMGRMTNGVDTFRTLEAYADYIVGNYNG